jgi:hypothetical protein
MTNIATTAAKLTPGTTVAISGGGLAHRRGTAITGTATVTSVTRIPNWLPAMRLDGVDIKYTFKSNGRTHSEQVITAIDSEVIIVAASTPMRDHVKAALVDHLRTTEALYCTRDWSAWGYKTMTEDDFVPYADEDATIDELTDAVIAAIARGVQ